MIGSHTQVRYAILRSPTRPRDGTPARRRRCSSPSPTAARRRPGAGRGVQVGASESSSAPRHVRGPTASPCASPIRRVHHRSDGGQAARSAANARQHGAIHFCVPHGLHLDPHAECRRFASRRTRSGRLDVRRRRRWHRGGESGRAWRSILPPILVGARSCVGRRAADPSTRHCTMASLGATARRLCHPEPSGIASFVRSTARAGRPAGRRVAPRVVLGRRLRARGVPVVPQFADLQLPDGSGFGSISQFPHVRWGIEIDVHPDHLLLEGTTKDKRRDRQCHRSAGRSSVSPRSTCSTSMAWSTNWLRSTSNESPRADRDVECLVLTRVS